MKNTFRSILNASAFASSGFVQKMYEDEKENLTKDLNGVKFETTITILDENDNPIMVARATSSITAEEPQPEKAPEALKSDTAEEMQTKAQEPKDIQNSFENAFYNTYYPMQYMMPYAMPIPQGTMPNQMAYAPQGNAVSQPYPVQQPVSVPEEKISPDAVRDTKAESDNSTDVNPINIPTAAVDNSVTDENASDETSAAEIKRSEKEETVQESAPENAVEASDNDTKNIQFTAMQDSKGVKKEETDKENSNDKRKKIEFLLKKYSEIN
ncbi:MAG: hypothetical protein ACLUFN_00970 [Eubacterium sp.]